MAFYKALARKPNHSLYFLKEEHLGTQQSLDEPDWEMATYRNFGL